MDLVDLASIQTKPLYYQYSILFLNCAKSLPAGTKHNQLTYFVQKRLLCFHSQRA